ncbi:cGMP-dependent protein kinase, isozyme 1-like [Plodia interpunctella]|uniref:cGMP-dependent protein kinase, isozyme 1-like n=1 Tax=Plodia interpunctella TaxID=58824 RepID=UPI0023687F75|nr:cGMP-dependent protein kinase, isozyme 1-like [Plodia interpunctella]
MVLCPPFKWSTTRRGFDLNRTPPAPEAALPRQTIILRDDFVDIALNGEPSNRNGHLENGRLSTPVKNNSLTVDARTSGKKTSYMSVESGKSSRDSDSETCDSRSSAGRKTLGQIIYEDSSKTETRRKRIALPPPVHIDVNDLQYDKYEKNEGSIQQIRIALMDNDFLKNLMDDDRLKMVTEAMNSQEFPAGSLIIREGESGSHLYVSAEGQFEVLKGGQVVKTFGAGVAFGELAILYRAKRFASIRCITHATVWTLERRIFQKIMVRSGRQEQDDNIRFLASVPLLEGIHKSALAKISECLKREFFSAGTPVVRQGDRGDKFYIIRGGTVVVTKRSGDDGEIRIGTLHRGDYFGEQALLRKDRRLATVTAQPPGVECLTLDRPQFTDLLGDLQVLSKKYPEPRPSQQRKKSEIKSEFEYVQLKDLEILGTLGVGGFGRVELVRYKPNHNLTFALKCLKKVDMVQLQQQENAYNEKHIMMDCDNPFICKLYRTFKDNKYVYFLMEPVLGGDVWTILQKRRFFTENVAKFMMACVVEAFQYLHSKDIIYRDLKPENLMMDRNGYIKLVDFGFAKRVTPNSKTWTFAGTPEYVAPEIVLNKGHDRAVDCWALGVFVHELIVGRPPFRAPGGDHMKTYTLILRGIDAVSFHPRVSNLTKAFIRKLCRPVPAERLGYLKNGMADIKNHNWFGGFDWTGLRERRLKAPLVQSVANNWDLSNFETYPNKDKLPPDETSGWDIDF